jgi:hypothetical protein
MGKDTIKGRVNARWHPSDAFRSAYDRIFHPCGDLDGDESEVASDDAALPCPPNPEQDQILNNNAADGCTEETEI